MIGSEVLKALNKCFNLIKSYIFVFKDINYWLIDLVNN